MRTTDVLIVGAGQAGLALSACLAQAGIDHVLIERGRVAERWRSERWDSLRLLTPNWMTRLPGHRYAGPDPEGFMGRAEVVDLLQDYAAAIGAPVEERTAVVSVRPAEEGFAVETDRGAWRARAVVVATGACDRPAVPGWAADLSPEIAQVVPGGYRNPAGLAAGGVLVVGASATGVQLAREIRAAGRPVTLAVGRHIRLPRRYRGPDIMEWMDRAGILDEPWWEVPDLAAARRQPSLQLSGAADGAGLDLMRLAAMGVRLVGRAVRAEGGRVAFGSNLEADCADAERRRRRVLARIDAVAGDAPADPAAWAAPVFPQGAAQEIDLRAEGIATVLWATGYRRDHGWLRVPGVVRGGEIAHAGGRTAWPGLYALGLPFLQRRSSTFIDGVGRDAEAIAAMIALHLDHRRPLAA
jgi:putative flavoprotein involved in K+ transport